MQNNQHKLSFLYTAARLTDVLEMLDEVHTAVDENALDTLNARGKAEIVAWLREIAYVANETVQELEQTNDHPSFRVIKGGGNGDNDREVNSPLAVDEQPGFEVLVTEQTPLPFYEVKRAGT